MNNIYKDAFNRKRKLLSELSEKKDVFNSLKYTLVNSNTLYLPIDFNFESFTTTLKLYLNNNLKLVAESKENNERVTEIIYFSESSFAEKLNLGTKFKILLYQIDNLLLFEINIADKTDQPNTKKSKISISALLNKSYKNEITDFIYLTAFDLFLKKNPKANFGFTNKYIEETSLNEKIFIGNIIKDDIILCKLNISSIKDESDPEKFKENKFACLLVTHYDVCLYSFGAGDKLIFFEELSEKFKIKKRLGKNQISYKTILCHPKKSNSDLFNDIENIQDKSDNNRIRDIARLYFKNKNFDSSESLIQLLIKKEKNPVNNFCLLLIESKRNPESIEKFVQENDITQIILNVLKTKNFENEIIELLRNWGISYNDKTIFLQLFVEIACKPEEKTKILPFYETIRLEFKKKNKNLINQSLFDLKYAAFLISSKKNRNAIKVLNKLLKHLPDETLSDLLPAKNLDLTGDKSGQLLKITALDLLTAAKGNKKSISEIQKTAQLQPLNLNRINSLASVKNKDLKTRANKILKVLKQNGLNDVENNKISSENITLNEKILAGLRHPATIKKGSFYSVQKWVSKIKSDDYTAVKEYSEKINSDNYPEIYKILESTKTIFGIPNIEYYISKGEKYFGIIGHESNPPFIIFSDKHLNPKSKHLLNICELQFCVATEIAHIYFKHTKLTSKDIWRGVSEKGTFLIDSLLSIVPVAGIIGKSVQTLPKLNSLTKIIKTSNQIISNSKYIFESALVLSEFYRRNLKLDSTEEKEQKLLAASRLMQYTADRTGIAISGNLQSAVRAIFLTGKYNFEFLEELKKSSLRDLLLIENSDGTYKNQELALRLANLFSFYISDEYKTIREKLN